MILASALLALTPMAAQAASDPVPEIVVLGRLRSLQARVGQDPEGRWHCSLSASTGRPSLDDRFCRAVTKCVQKGASDNEAVDACIRTSRARLVKRVEKELKKDS